MLVIFILEFAEKTKNYIKRILRFHFPFHVNQDYVNKSIGKFIPILIRR